MISVFLPDLTSDLYVTFERGDSPTGGVSAATVRSHGTETDNMDVLQCSARRRRWTEMRSPGTERKEEIKRKEKLFTFKKVSIK